MVPKTWLPLCPILLSRGLLTTPGRIRSGPARRTGTCRRPSSSSEHLTVRGHCTHDCPARGPRCLRCCLRPVLTNRSFVVSAPRPRPLHPVPPELHFRATVCLSAHICRPASLHKRALGLTLLFVLVALVASSPVQARSDSFAHQVPACSCFGVCLPCLSGTSVQFCSRDPGAIGNPCLVRLSCPAAVGLLGTYCESWALSLLRAILLSLCLRVSAPLRILCLWTLLPSRPSCSRRPPCLDLCSLRAAVASRPRAFMPLGPHRDHFRLVPCLCVAAACGPSSFRACTVAPPWLAPRIRLVQLCLRAWSGWVCHAARSGFDRSASGLRSAMVASDGSSLGSFCSRLRSALPFSRPPGRLKSAKHCLSLSLLWLESRETHHRPVLSVF